MDDQEIIETIRRCYYNVNKDYIEKQISEASKYLSDAQKKELKARVSKFLSSQSAPKEE